MRGALLYLTLCSIRNRMRVRIRRLREPRYLIGLIVGLLYFRFVIFRPRRPSSRGVPAGAGAGVAPYRSVIEVIGGLGLLVIAASVWLLPASNRPALTFSRSDVQFLFTAPISRRQLINYKILRSQMGAVIGSLLMTFVFRASSGVAAWQFFVGTTVLMTTINLHLTGVSLRRESLASHGAAGLARQWIPLALIGSAVVVVAATVAVHWSELSGLTRPELVLREIQRLGTTGPVAVVLFPFTALVRLPFSATTGDFARALPAALAILAANYIWVIRSDAAFEEAAALYAERQASDRPAGQRPPRAVRIRPAPFALGPVGRPETALLWKNLILSGRYASARLFLNLLPIVVFAGFLMAQSTHTMADTLAAFCVIGAIGIVLVGPQIARNDLRQDLAHLSLLKAWPVPGAAIVRGEVLAPTVLLSAIVWLLIVAATFLSSRVPFDAPMPMLSRLSFATGAMLLAPGVILVQIVVQNGFAVMFPAWVDLGASRTRGVDVMGQRLLVFGGLFIIVAVALVPAALIAALVGWAIHAVTGALPIIVPAAAALVVIVLESAVAVEAIGALFDRTDPGAIAAAE